jgi:hypothetical protein
MLCGHLCFDKFFYSFVPWIFASIRRKDKGEAVCIS